MDGILSREVRIKLQEMYVDVRRNSYCTNIFVYDVEQDEVVNSIDFELYENTELSRKWR